MKEIKMFKGIIYKATNTVTGEVYIGQTVTKLSKRKGIHHFKARRSKNPSKFHISLLKYKGNFKWEIIETINTNKDDLNKCEMYWIAYYDSTRKGLNTSPGGGIVAKETGEKISKALTGRKLSKEHAAACGRGHRGKKLSKEHIEALRRSTIGRVKSKEEIEKQRESRKGYVVTKETREKISKANKGRVLSKEHKEKISRGLTGRIVTKETREKLSRSNKGKHNTPHSKETREKISNNSANSKAILQLDRVTGEVLNRYKSGASASLAVCGEKSATINKVANPNYPRRVTAYGYGWVYEEDYYERTKKESV